MTVTVQRNAIRTVFFPLPFPRWAACLLTLLFLAVSALAAGPKCDICSQSITGKYIQLEGKAYCSQQCYRRALPRCAVCDEVIEGKHIRSQEKTFCSNRCFELILPRCKICARPLRKAFTIDGHTYCEAHSQGPFCCNCALPFKQGRELPDKRICCDNCLGRVVLTTRRALAHYRRAEKEVAQITGMGLSALPKLELVGLDRMPNQRTDNSRGTLVQRGLYERITKTTTKKNIFGWTLKEEREVTESVLLLYGLEVNALIVTAAHELTHATLAEHFPEIAGKAPKWVEEGICQYVAAEVCRRNGFHRQRELIESCPDTDYGDGYRYFKERFGANNWKGLAAWLGQVRVENLPGVVPAPPSRRQRER